MSLKKSSIICAALCLVVPFIIARVINPEDPIKKPFVLMLCPAGDAQHMGRNISNSFEHSLALKWVNTLKERLSDHGENLTIIITHNVGESVDHLQLATFANRVAPDLFLRVGFYEQHDGPSTWYLYHFSYGDTFITTFDQNKLYPYDQAHLFAYKATKNYAQQMYHLLTALNTKKSCIIHQPYQLPFKPLIGITSPAIAFEIGIKEVSDWHISVEPVARALEHIIAQQRQL